jgi:hypothetical protein
MSDRMRGSRPQRPRRSRREMARTADGMSVQAAEAAAPVATAPPVTTATATLLTRHILRDGETIILILKPSLWTIFFNTMPAVAIGLIIAIGTSLSAARYTHIGVEAALMLVSLRAAWTTMSWASRVYLLTEMRVLRVAGVFSPQIQDIPLRKIARTRLNVSLHERIWRLGSIEIIPESEQWPWSVWQTIPRPNDAHDVIRRTIARAKQGGCYGI